MGLYQDESRRISANFSKGQITKFQGKRWVFLGANKKEAFFANARKNSKYASYAPIYNSKIVFNGMMRMSITPDEVCKAHGF